MLHAIDRALVNGPLRPGMADCCRVWPGRRDRDGYGLADVDGWPVGVHRLAWEQQHGPIPRGLVVRHRCDNPPCARIDHLQLGTVVDNARDRQTRGRSANQAGAANGHARLSPAQVRAIRTANTVGGISQRTLARAFRVSQTHVSDIVTGRRWPDVER